MASAEFDWARPVVHWEIVARQPEVQADFYRRLFNWEIGDGDFKVIAPGLGGPEPGPSGHLRAGEHPAVVIYIQVGDIRRSLQRVPELGGKVNILPFDVPGGPTVAFIEDPEGNPLGLVQQ
jgi:predicted enzyme related to lactoylglutathione lyase